MFHPNIKLVTRHPIYPPRTTKSIIYKLMYYALSAGALTMITSTIALICFNASKTTISFVGVLEVMTKVYANSMLAMYITSFIPL
ncbi:hypothetical protein BC629DRAFT_1456573 [Irpex lacteus]|nr:hypothetical protein BC629DRAFT_1456573 [Irpex lacteus]